MRTGKGSPPDEHFGLTAARLTVRRPTFLRGHRDLPLPTKRAPRKKRKQPAIVSRIVTPAPLKPLKGPVIRLEAQVPNRTEFPPAEPQPKRPATLEPKQKPRPLDLRPGA
jgi:hypothetical protein